MKGIYFGEVHSYKDLNLLLEPFTPTPAKPQTNLLKIPGRDGYLDLTEANGEVKFNSREFQFAFTIAPGDTLTFDERVSKVASALNGLRCKITLDRDPDYYWTGRCAVDKYAQNKNIGRIVVKATVDPYKLKHKETVTVVVLDVTGSGSGSMDLVLKNGRMVAVPTIECTEDGVIFSLNGIAYTLASGENRNLDIRLGSGNNEVTVIGTGTVTITWQEGEL